MFQRKTHLFGGWKVRILISLLFFFFFLNSIFIVSSLWLYILISNLMESKQLCLWAFYTGLVTEVIKHRALQFSSCLLKFNPQPLCCSLTCFGLPMP